jgi:pyruvate dehydrogenase E1 component beta subunit
MERDESVFILGLGVDDARGMYGTTLDLQKVFGPHRNFDTPLSEDAMTGVAIGAALAGMRPIHVHQRMDFLLLCMNQLVNIAAKSSYMFAGSAGAGGRVRSTVRRSIPTSCTYQGSKWWRRRHRTMLRAAPSRPSATTIPSC